MSKQSLLLVDGDARSLRVLEVSLRKAGFSVTPAASVQDALDKLELHAPDLIISETTFPDGDGFELRRRVRGTPDWAEIPFIFLTAEAAIENKIRGLELGVDDYLTKPIYIKEIVTRINILLQKRQRVRFEERRDGRTRFAGRVADMPVVDVIQTIEISRKSGVIQFVGERGRQAAIYFRDGKVIDAEAGTLQGEDAVYRLLTWSEGEFEVVFRTVRRRDVITASSQGLLMEGMRRLDEWSRLLEQLPPLTHRFEVDTTELAGRLGDVPDDNNPILRLLDGKRTLLEVIDASDFGDLECLQVVSRLYFEELLLDLDHGNRPRRDTGRPMPLIEIDTPTPIEEVVSGPINLSRLSRRADAESEGPESWAAGLEPSSEEGRTGPESSAAWPESSRESSATGSESSRESGTAGSAGPESPREASAAGLVGAEAGAAGLAGAEASAAGLAGAEASAAGLAGAEASAAGFVGAEASAAGFVGAEASAAGFVGAEARTARTAREVAGAAPAENGVDDDAPLGELRGSYRPSGLRLIDEAVAAAQAIDPSLFDDVVNEAVASAAAEPVHGELDPEEVTGGEVVDDGETNGSSVPHEIVADEPSPAPRRRANRTTQPRTSMRRDDSGLRMIGSLGRDRAEASGELMPLGGPQSTLSETQRELVTILPRRVTRDVPPPPSPEESAESAEKAESAEVESVVVARPRPVTSPQLTRTPPRVTPPGTGVRREPRPGAGAIALIALAVLLAGVAMYLWLRRPGTHKQLVVAGDAAQDQISSSPASFPDAAAAAERVPVVAGDAGVPVVAGDAGVPVVAGDADVPVVAGDAGVPVVAGDAGVPVVAGDASTVSADVAQAKVLSEQAHDAIQEGDFDRALTLANASLKLRKTARTFLVRAQALQRLDRVDEALDSVDSAAKVAPDYAAVWELRGNILWAARRRAEALEAYDKFLQIEPDGPRAAQVKRRINAPR